MGLDKPKHKPHPKKQTDLSGYESAQRKRFLRAEIEEEISWLRQRGADTSSSWNGKWRDRRLIGFGHGLVGVSSVVLDTTEQTFTEDFLETKTCPKSRCKVRR